MIGGGELESLHGDVRHAGVLAARRDGYESNLGYNRSGTWTRSRTSFDRGDLRREYADATDTPRHRGSLGASHRSRRGWESAIHVYVTEGFEWAAGVLSGRVPSRETVDARLGYRIDTNLRVHVLATILFDQERYHIFGSSPVDRGVLAAFAF